MTLEELKAMLDTADEYIQKGNFDEAENLANQALTEMAKNPTQMPEREGIQESSSFPTGEGRDGVLTEKVLRELQTLRGFAFITLCRANSRRGDYQTALTFARRALDIAEESNIPVLHARALGNIGSVYQCLSDYTEALTYLHKALAVNEELGRKTGIAYCLEYIGLVYYSLSDYARALEYLQKGLAIEEELGSKNGIAGSFANIGCVYHDLSDYAKALEYHQKSLAINEELGTKYGIAGDLHNIGRVYSNLSDSDRAMEYFQKAMVLNEETGNKAWLAHNFICIGIVYQSLSDYAKALDYYQQALVINEELGSKDSIANSLANIGWLLYESRSDYLKTLGYMKKALAIYEEIGAKEGIGRNLCNIGIVYATPNFAGYDPVRAEEYLRNSLVISRETGSKSEQNESCKWLADFYKNHKRWEEAHEYLEQSVALEKEVQSEEAKKQAGLIEQRRQAAEREKFLAVERARAQATEELLHKTLPPSIADRVIKGETRIADHFESASILFADVVGFTQLSAKLPPAAVLAFMNFLFEHFDALAAKHGCERIKTIGDGYMAVCGAPVRYPNHAQRLTLMALDMMEDIILPEDIREHLPAGTVFHLRIGLHCGEITAGLIGTGKLAYDIYGDAVNTAARMESHGEAGKIHVSEDFAFHLQNRMDMTGDDLGGIVFVEREEIEIKGKGLMKTYFLER